MPFTFRLGPGPRKAPPSKRTTWLSLSVSKDVLRPRLIVRRRAQPLPCILKRTTINLMRRCAVVDLQGLKNWLRTEQPDLLRIGRLVRYELGTRWIDLHGRLSPRNRATIRQLRRSRGHRLHIASGQNRISGWINVDAAPGADVKLDLRRRLPLASESAALIFSEHFLDHLEFPNVALRVLRDWHRLLEPRGRLRLVVHDAELLARAYLERDAEFFRVAAFGDKPPFIEAVNNLYRFNGTHQFIYDFEMIEKLLLEAGFQRVHRSTFRGSEIDELNLDIDSPNRFAQSLYVEAIK
jgi:predicted SAM-dependent methyltransferase